MDYSKKETERNYKLLKKMQAEQSLSNGEVKTDRINKVLIIIALVCLSGFIIGSIFLLFT